MSKWKQLVLGKIGYTYGGLTNKTILDFGIGKPFLPYMNIFSNGRINPRFVNYVQIYNGEKQNTVKYGDLFFTTSSETVEEVGMTSVLLDDMGEAYLNSFCFGFRLNNFDDLLPEFAPYLFRGDVMRKKISLFGQGSTRYNLPKTELLEKLTIDLPSIPEQRKIAQILSTTDSVIEKTQAAIAKYKAIKQGMLHDLFTRGIDVTTGKLRPKQQDAPELYKESKLGWMPKEWNVEELGMYCDRVSVGIATSSSDFFVTEGVLFLRNQNIKENRIDLSDRIYITKEFADANASKYLRKGDVITVRTGYPGISAVVPHELEGSQTFTTLITSPNSKLLNSYYLSYFLNSNFGKYQVLNLQGGGAQQNLNSGALEKMSISKPEINEQESIVQKMRTIENNIESEQTYLQKLQMLKSGLMNDLLSGKKEVKLTDNN